MAHLLRSVIGIVSVEMQYVFTKLLYYIHNVKKLNVSGQPGILGHQSIGLMSRVIASGPGDPGGVIPKTQKMVLNAKHSAL